MIDKEKKLTQIAIKFLGIRPRLSGEIILRLKKESKDNTLINQIIEKLKKSRLINDYQFISDYIEFHTKTKLQGPRLIQAKLIALGADQTEVNSILKNLLDSTTLVTIAKRLIQKKTKKFPLNTLEKAKIYRFLNYRGFPLETIKKALTTID
jgi:regulatory protein